MNLMGLNDKAVKYLTDKGKMVWGGRECPHCKKKTEYGVETVVQYNSEGIPLRSFTLKSGKKVDEYVQLQYRGAVLTALMKEGKQLKSTTWSWKEANDALEEEIFGV